MCGLVVKDELHLRLIRALTFLAKALENVDQSALTLRHIQPPSYEPRLFLGLSLRAKSSSLHALKVRRARTVLTLDLNGLSWLLILGDSDLQNLLPMLDH